MKRIHIALTGATGLLGRNLLFEFIKKYKDNFDDLTILILGRREGSMSLKDRIFDIVLDEAIPYIGLCDVKMLKEFLEKNVECIETDLTSDNLGISSDHILQLRHRPIDFFFHIASLTDFRNSPMVKKKLWEANVKGTEQILELLATLDVREYCYVSSAYCCGKTHGDIMPDYINLNAEFRNDYEQSKLEAEIKSRDFAKRNGIRFRSFRPSTISGRLMEAPLGAINKFDVFYGFAAFWLQMKLALTLNPGDRYSVPVLFDVAMCYNTNSGLNIVPVDYAAKVMYEVCMQNHPDEDFHLANNAETPHRIYVSAIFEALNISGIQAVDEIPVDLNRLEALYYKTVGKIFTPYIVSKPMHFNTQNLKEIELKCGLQCPEVDKDNFIKLLDYAKEKDFGIRIKKLNQPARAEFSGVGALRA